MKNFKIIILYFTLLFIPQFIHSQNNDTPLSFDKSDIPFSKIENFVFRGDDFFYESTYESVKYYSSNYAFAIILDGLINSSKNNLLKFTGKDLDLSTNAYCANLNIIGMAGWFFYQFYANFRSYHYFSYSKDDGSADTKNDINFDGSIISGIASFALGFYPNSIFTPVFVVNRLESDHENKENDLYKIPEEYRNIYLDRFQEVDNRLYQSGFNKKEIYSFSFIGYSKIFGIGCILAPKYTKIDIGYVYGINSVKDFFEFSQIGLNPIKIVKKISHLEFSKNSSFFEYYLKTNFAKSLFKEYKNIISDFEFTWDWVPNYSGVITNIKFDHSKKLLSFFSVSLKFYAFKIGYEYFNSEVFMPDLDRIYNRSLKLSIGAGFSKDGKLVVP